MNSYTIIISNELAVAYILRKFFLAKKNLFGLCSMTYEAVRRHVNHVAAGFTPACRHGAKCDNGFKRPSVQESAIKASELYVFTNFRCEDVGLSGMQ